MFSSYLAIIAYFILGGIAIFLAFSNDPQNKRLTKVTLLLLGLIVIGSAISKSFANISKYSMIS
jgi:hypothetical protein